MKKLIEVEDFVEKLKDGMTIMIGGFLANGAPDTLIDILVERNVKDLTLIVNDTAFIDRGVGKLIVNKQVKKVITSHIGTNSETGRQMHAQELEVQLVPQGTLAERIRAKGAGLGGVLTPTGIGTIVEEGKEKIEVDQKTYLLELPLGADLALIKGSIVDYSGNVWYNKSTRNFNPVMATAADMVIVEAEKLVEIGEIDSSNVVTPGIFVDYIVRGRA